MADARLLAITTVSMGLGPISAIYQALMMKYLHTRGLKDLGDERFGDFG